MTARRVTFALLALTVAQLAVATFVPGLEQFEGKAFGARLVAYPLMMLLVPAVWMLVRHLRGGPDGLREPLPWAGFAWIMAPFLVDVTGNTLDLYDSVAWWDDANHFVNWLLLGLGVAVVGVGAVLAVAWELAEWWTFIRHGTELDTAYEDTLGDLALGTLGSLTAGLALMWWRRTRTA